MHAFRLPDRFQVLEELSSTEDTVLLRARDELLHREVLVSGPAQDVRSSEDPSEIARSLRQARALARVQHRGVIRLLDVLETEVGPALVMEPVAGETLAEILARRERLAPDETRDLGIALASALEAVHAAGVVHRGISAGNVLVRADGSPCLTGFVFAKFRGTGQTVFGTTFAYPLGRTGAPASVVTQAPPHPAPEQILGHPADARSDLFALGWVLYECLAGASPYPSDLEPDRWKAPADPRSLARGVPKELAETILACLRTSPARRIASAREVRERLERAAPPPSAPGSARSRKPALLVGAGGVVLAASVWWTIDRLGSAHAVSAEDADGSAARGFGPTRAGAGAPVYADRYEDSHALLIGVGDAYARHGFPALPNAERDVAAIADRLRSIRSEQERWDVQVLQGPAATRDEILARLRTITDAAKQDDKVFVYYAGHGIRHEVSDRSGWIIPADGLTEGEDPSRGTWIRFDEFSHLFDESQAKHVLVAMDCCYGGRLVASRAGSAAAYGKRLLAEPAKVVLCSGRPNEQVSDGVRGGNSPFARAFLDVLSRPGADVVTTTDVFASIQKRFLEEDVPHLPLRGTPPGAPLAGEVVFFLE